MSARSWRLEPGPRPATRRLLSRHQIGSAPRVQRTYSIYLINLRSLLYSPCRKLRANQPANCRLFYFARPSRVAYVESGSLSPAPKADGRRWQLDLKRPDLDSSNTHRRNQLKQKALRTPIFGRTHN